MEQEGRSWKKMVGLGQGRPAQKEKGNSADCIVGATEKVQIKLEVQGLQQSRLGCGDYILSI